MMNLDIDTAVEVLVEAIKTDYRNWTSLRNEDLTGHQGDMVAEFEGNIRVKEGSKYIKIISGSGVWGFIVKADSPCTYSADAKFKAGDILMAAGWNAPAKNAARGNIFNGYRVQWTGPNYLK